MLEFISQTSAFQGTELLIGLLIGLVVSLFFRPVKYFVTMVHEFGHAFLTLLTFGKIYQIRINQDTSGSTEVRSGLRAFFSTLAGYPAPFLLALLLLEIIKSERPQLTLLLLTLISLIVLFYLRNAWGFLCVFLMLGLLVLAFHFQTVFLNYLISAALFTILFIGAWHDVLVLFKSYVGPSDADILYLQVRFIPAFLWKILFLLISLFLTVVIGREFWQLLMLSL